MFFKMSPKNIRRQAFVMMNISCKFEISVYNTFCSGGVTGKSLHTAAVEYPCINVSKSIHQMLSSGYNEDGNKYNLMTLNNEHFWFIPQESGIHLLKTGSL